jgi:hypothetical protein
MGLSIGIVTDLLLISHSEEIFIDHNLLNQHNFLCAVNCEYQLWYSVSSKVNFAEGSGLY